MNSKETIKHARTMIGTPFILQGRLPKYGLDCAGLIEEVAKHGNFVFNDQKSYDPDQWAGSKLLTQVKASFDPIDKLENACILLLWFRCKTKPQHFAIYTENNTIIHCTEKYGEVKEVTYDKKWQKLTHSIWKFKEVQK